MDNAAGRLYPALTLTLAAAPEDDERDQVLAELDAFRPTAVEDQPFGLRAFFSTPAARDAAMAFFAAQPSLTCTVEDVPDERWAERSQAALTPVLVGRLTIAPPWTVTPESRRHAPGPVIVIQPSMGFGTGHHASTRLCLGLLQQIPVTGRAVLDIGTGSGVLAISAHVLGASVTIGLDVDPDAIASAQENVELNGVADAVGIREYDVSTGPTRLGRRFDVILANLTGGLLCRDAGIITTFAAPGAHLIVSGFQTHEVAEVTGAFREAGWVRRDTTEEESWVGVTFALS